MAREIERSIAREERFRERGEALVLRLRERHVVGTFELDADGEVVTTFAALPRRGAGVPRALVAIDVLRDRSVAPDQEMRRDLEPGDFREIRMRVGIEPAEEEIVDPWPAVIAGRQRDVVDDDERDRRAGRAIVAVGR